MMREWKTVGVVIEGERISFAGIDPWNYEWRPLEEPEVELSHPTYPHQKHKMSIYEIETGGRSVVFAAGELSANVWGFYVPV